VTYDRIVRRLHAGIALAAVIQLLTSQIMQVPQPGRALLEPRHFFFVMHEWSGMTLVTLLVLHWLWVSAGHIAGGWGHLYPWFSRSRLQALFASLKALPAWLREARSLKPEAMDRLAGAVHGLGLLTITGMALTGVAWAGSFAPCGGPMVLLPILCGLTLSVTLPWQCCTRCGASAYSQGCSTCLPVKDRTRGFYLRRRGEEPCGRPAGAPTIWAPIDRETKQEKGERQ
jgi:hypothetical protein